MNNKNLTAAIEWYKKGLRHIQRDCVDKCVIVKASLYNSLGVAHHHRTTRWAAGKPIPPASFNNYKKSRDIILAHPEYKKQFALLSKKLLQNSAGHVRVGGGGGGGCGCGGGCECSRGGGGCNCMAGGCCGIGGGNVA